jgi:hypothetical protein
VWGQMAVVVVVAGDDDVVGRIYSTQIAISCNVNESPYRPIARRVGNA